MIKLIKNAIEFHKTERELNRLDERTLADIGIVRSDIKAVARRGFNPIF